MERYRSPDDEERKRRGSRRRTEEPKAANQNVKPLDIGKTFVDGLNRGAVADKKQEEGERDDIEKNGE